MLPIKIAIIVCLVHLGLYLIFFTYSEIRVLIVSYSSGRIEFDRLRTKYKVNIRTLPRSSSDTGFASFKTIYLNEKLLMRKVKDQPDPHYAFKFAFHHEHYHLIHHHKRSVLLMRFIFLLLPILLAVDWILFAVMYGAYAYGMAHLIDIVFEKNANNHAKAQMNDKEGNLKKKKNNN